MFKNAIAYQVTEGYHLDTELLMRRPARPCGALESRTDGFAAPCQHANADLAHTVGGYTLICLETEDRLLPGSVVADEAEARAKQIEIEQERKVGRKEFREIKERVIEELLPKSFTQRKRTFAVFAGGFFIIDTSSPARAETVLHALHQAVENVPLAQIRTVHAVSGKLTDWLLGDEPEGISIDDFCEMERPDMNKPAVAYKRVSLEPNEMERRIREGYVPRKLGVTYNDRMSFRIDESMHLTQISALELLLNDQRHAQQNAEDAAEAFDTDVVLVVGEIVSALRFLIFELGGIVEPEADLVSPGAGMEKLCREEGVTATISHGGTTVATFGNGDDPLYPQAKALVLAEKRGSISMVQRHLRIGYNRAARLVDAMEAEGIVSPMGADGSRSVISERKEA